MKNYIIKRRDIIYLLISLVSITSCDYEKDLFEMQNDSPGIQFMYKETYAETIEDSLKISDKELGNTPIPFQIKINDRSQNLTITANNINRGELFINGSRLTSPIGVKSNNIHNLEYIPNVQGQHELEFIVKDTYGKSKTCKSIFYIFNNLLPEAEIDIKVIGQNSPYEIEISGERSYDKDSKWGGKVVTYKYKVGSYYEYTSSSFKSIKHILPGPGKYIISLQVIDNDNGESQTKFKEITI